MTRDATTLADAERVVSRGGRRVALATLCATQITSWGVLFYAFPVLAGDITAATGWPAAAITGALSASQLVAALVGIPGGGGWTGTARAG
ncbi:hypothetical protein CLV71_11214 [Actinophytocola oryzae]|uniref:MFS transporter n=1 Tax=Actinophytocola oryzae TaxID=502181 RepID=A0A4R7V8W4_9PSEU|nr:hypothetical protein CLV71_11214 [Actinophytocola oryzae]